jgi:hypothetical protein
MDIITLIFETLVVLLLVFLYVSWKSSNWQNIFMKTYLFLLILMGIFVITFNPLIKELWNYQY